MPKYLIVNDKIDISHLTDEEVDAVINEFDDLSVGAVKVEVVTED